MPEIIFVDRASAEGQGFTLIEVAIFLVIAGAVLSVAALAWNVLAQGRQVAAAKNILTETDNCLVDFTILAKKIPDTTYFSKHCSKTDPWGQELRLISLAEGNPVSCSASTSGTLSLKVDPWHTVDQVVWVVISPGPNRQFDYNLTGTTLDISSGDDIYVFESDMGIHEEICN